MTMKGAAVQFFAALAASFAFLSYGGVASWSSPAVPSLLNNSMINQTDVPAISSLAPLGASTGTLMAGPLMDKFGRRYTLMAAAIPWATTFVVLSFANKIEVFYVCRFILGFMVGVTTPTAQLYIAECVDAKRRGAFGSLTALLQATGILLCYVIGKFLRWDHLSQVLAAFPCLLFIGMTFSPPSPVWLTMKSKSNIARKSLATLSGKNLNDPEVSALLERLVNGGQSLGFRSRLRKISQSSSLKPLSLAVTIYHGFPTV